MAKRNDIHAPSTFDPAAYTYERIVDLARPKVESIRMEDPALARAIEEAYEREFNALMERVATGKFIGNFVNKGTCDHCGARFIYGAEYKHKEGNVIVVGNICADDAFGSLDRRDYDTRRAQSSAKTRRARIANALRAAIFIEEAGLKSVFSHRDHESRGGEILAELHSKLTNYGSLSEKQVAFARKLAREIENPKPLACDFCGGADHVAKECPNRGSVPLTDARISIRARIITARYEENQYGSSLKGLFETATGYKLWGTIPAAIHDAFFYDSTTVGHNDKTLDDLRGQYVTFVARVIRSDDDRSFGFIKRPSKAGLDEPFENTPVFSGGVPESGDRTDEELRDALVAARKAL